METKPVTEVDSNMVIVKTGGWIIQHRTQYEIAEDAVALLLKHSVGHHINKEDEGVSKKEESKQGSGRSRKKKKTDKKVLGPHKPEYLDETTDYDSSWVPPKGKSVHCILNRIQF